MTLTIDEAVTAVPPHALTIETHRTGRTTVLRLSGELDMAGEQRLREAVRHALRTRPRTLVLDLSGLLFTDCTGLSVMVWTRNLLARQGGVLQIRDPRPNVLRVLEFARLDAHLAPRANGRTRPARPGR
ncbi:STAS domain-containing protein [Actinomadura sediminis]|uniref:Anti-sigma factor antagonist n=1 Tax=Actinomadura sediminis TaxID=1038904 RepID=A0ABW3EUR7_9ACTN